MEAFKYTYHFFWGLEDVIAVFTNMWSQLDRQGGRRPVPERRRRQRLGRQGGRLPAGAGQARLQAGRPGRYQNLTDNFSAQINAFKKAKCEIVTGVVIPPDFTTFWTQALQQGFKPKVASVGKALLFPSRRGAGRTRQQSLDRSVVDAEPSVQIVAHRAEQQAARRCLRKRATKKQWTQPIGFAHALFEVAADVLKRSAGPGERKAITRGGHRPSSTSSARSSGRSPGAGQWRRSVQERLQDAAGRRS
jgi:branched-chain amino acid transport system substrate-binding protein